MCDELMCWQFVVCHVVTKPFAAMRQPEGSQVKMSDDTYSLLTVSVLLVVSVIGFTYRSVVGNPSRFAVAPDAT